MNIMNKAAEDEDLRQATLYHKIFETGIDHIKLVISKDMEDHCKSLNLGVDIVIDNNLPHGYWMICEK